MGGGVLLWVGDAYMGFVDTVYRDEGGVMLLLVQASYVGYLLWTEFIGRE